MKARTLLADTHPSVYAEVTGVVGRPEHSLAELGTYSNLKAQWQCVTCGNVWTATPASRSAGGRCPKCVVLVRAASRARAPRGKALADLHPEISSEFVRNESHPENTPERLRAASQQRCCWRCACCGHEWVTAVANRTAGRGCPQCANERRAVGRRAVRKGVSAADRAPALVAELVENLTSPGIGMEERRPASIDRCVWRCTGCGLVWEATITNRVTKNSGCPRCGAIQSAATRRIPRPSMSLADTHPHLVGQLVANETHPGRMAADMPTLANDRCRWRCRRGHEWSTRVHVRANGSGCPRCNGFGRSRFELEVAELLHASCGTTVAVDVEVAAVGRTWRLDLYLPGSGLHIDLDPVQWHSDLARDARKVAALSDLDYLRVRPEELGAVEGQVCIVTGDGGACDPVVWAKSLGSWLAARQLPCRVLSSEETGRALARAARAWTELAVGKPGRSASDAAPYLVSEFVENLTRPGIGLEWMAPSAKDRARWTCKSCGWMWNAVVGSRAQAGAGCPKCATQRLGHRSSIPQQGRSLAALHPELAAEFLSCPSHPGRSPDQLHPSSNFRCTWRCRACGHEWEASPAGRERGRGCPPCAREKAGRARSVATPEHSLYALHPTLAGEFLECLDEPGRTPQDLLPKSNKNCRWRCTACGHEWRAQVATRTTGNGCPACGRTRSAQIRATAPPGKCLADLFPLLAAEAIENIDRPERNPRSLKPGSHARCRWHCTRCGHTWITSVKNRAIQGTQCPACVQAGRCTTSSASNRS
ncbi:zinc-ribbon domain-containing protein [[Kitasatospora] papulosa]|uniref:zinc-ribbon domain-containing protein n=1 Tax=Streptomyces TaxID=1883 RepID=UPI0036755207